MSQDKMGTCYLRVDTAEYFIWSGVKDMIPLMNWMAMFQIVPTEMRIKTGPEEQACVMEFPKGGIILTPGEVMLHIKESGAVFSLGFTEWQSRYSIQK